MQIWKITQAILQHRCAELCLSNKKDKQVILSTCTAYLENANGMRNPARVILWVRDQFSDKTYCRLIGYSKKKKRKKKTNFDVFRINGKM